MVIPTQLSGLPGGPTAPTVLVVEDEPVLRLTLASELRQAGFRVREAANATEAETVLKIGAPVDLVITDIEMPGARDGLALAAAVRALAPHTRVIVVSGLAPGSEIVGLADAFFGKPYDVDRLVRHTQALLAATERGKPRRDES